MLNYRSYPKNTTGYPFFGSPCSCATLGCNCHTTHAVYFIKEYVYILFDLQSSFVIIYYTVVDYYRHVEKTKYLA